MKRKLLASALATAGLLAAAAANAESTIGVQSAASAVAAAHLDVRIVVPKVIALRVGTGGSTIDVKTFTVTGDGLAGNTNSQQAAAGPNQPYASGPVALSTTGALAVTVAAWTNAAGSTLTCAAGGTGGATTAMATSGTNVPVFGDITVTTTGGGNLPAPSANLDCAGSTAMTNNTNYADTWTYALTGTLTSYQAGSYGTRVTYTAATP